MPPEASTVDHRALLEEERTELLAKLAELGLGGAGLTYDSNFADSSQVTAERGEVEALAATLRETLEDVERALGKLTEGNYGVCEDCGQPIDPLRLEAKPAARYCINCAANTDPDNPVSTWGPPPASGRPRRQTLSPRATIWIIAGVALAVLLFRTHKVTTFDLLFYGSLIPSVILHEVSHGAAALAFGDDTAKRAGRLTLNPVSHIDPFGTHHPAGTSRPQRSRCVRLRQAGARERFAPAQPAQHRFGGIARGPRGEHRARGAVGPVLQGFRGRIEPSSRRRHRSRDRSGRSLLFVAGYVNVILAVFNLIPLPPLDGSAVLERLLPRNMLPGYYRIRPFTIFLPLIILVVDPGAFYSLFNWAYIHYANAVI